MMIILCFASLLNAGAAVLSLLSTKPGKSGAGPVFSGPRTLFIGACCALVSGFCAYRLTSSGLRTPASIKLLSVFPVLLASSATDLLRMRIPNRLVVILLMVRILLIPADCVVVGMNRGLRMLLMSAVSGAVLFLILFLFSQLLGGGLGMGDVKLCAAAGFLTGPRAAFFAIAAGTGACAVFSAFLLAWRKRTLRDRLPFAPFLYFGFLIASVLGRA